MLIHCGDVCGWATEKSVTNFAHWFDRLPHEHKIVIAGNHDKHMSSKWFTKSTYLQDSGVDIEGTYFYGSPWTPTAFNWYWMKDRGPEIKEKWDKIPTHTDVLITHGPCSDLEYLSKIREGQDLGCVDLKEAIDRVKPKLHCFGHIHEGYGERTIEGVQHVNASYLTRDYLPRNAPVVIDL